MMVDNTVLIEPSAQCDLNNGVPLLCWKCGSLLIPDLFEEATYSSGTRCMACKIETICEDGVWRALSLENEACFRNFIHQYQFIREAEGRGSLVDEYYLALPFKDFSGRNARQWKIRAHTYTHLLLNVVNPIVEDQGRTLRILDLGAGNGWLSYRLALLGHSVVAADLLLNAQDGLGAATHYAQRLHALFPRVQTDMDHLPFPNSVFDLIIFNASFHYSSDYVRTLQEALRCTVPDGEVVIADTAWYEREESGEEMVEEKHDSFRTKYGFPSNALASQEYLTPARILQLSSNLDLKWKVLKPFHGMQWALRPLLAKIRGRRVPSQFFLHVVRAKQ